MGSHSASMEFSIRCALPGGTGTSTCTCTYACRIDVIISAHCMSSRGRCNSICEVPAYHFRALQYKSSRPLWMQGKVITDCWESATPESLNTGSSLDPLPLQLSRLSPTPASLLLLSVTSLHSYPFCSRSGDKEHPTCSRSSINKRSFS